MGDSRMEAAHVTILWDLGLAQAWQDVTVRQDGLWASADWIGIYASRAAGPQFFDGLGGFLNVYPHHFRETAALARAIY